MQYQSFVIIVFMALAAVVLPGCSFLAGTGAGVVGAGASYEVNARKQMDKLDEDYKAGKITKQEYETRKDQIKKGSLIY